MTYIHKMENERLIITKWKTKDLYSQNGKRKTYIHKMEKEIQNSQNGNERINKFLLPIDKFFYSIKFR